MSEIPKPTPTLSLVLLALAGAAAGFFLSQSAGGGPADATPVASVAPAPPAVVPIVVSGLGGSAAPTDPVVVQLDLTEAGAPKTAVVPVNLAGVQPAAVAPSVAVATSSSPRSSSVTSPATLHDYSISVDGNNVVIASDGSIVQVGDNGELDANTGDASAGGSVGVDVSGSTIMPGSTAAAHETQSFSNHTQTATPASNSADFAGAAPLSYQLPTGQPGFALHQPSIGAAVSIAGFEDHSITAIGDDNLVTYDDSNIFVNRDGHINANTGDTDSSGLNVVDATGSVVRSGNSGDGEGGDDDEDEEEEQVEAPLADDTPTRDDAFEVEDSSTSGPWRSLQSPTATTSSPASASVDDEDVRTTATGNGAFVIGGDGFDDLAIRLAGNRNIITYDDGNVVVGGTGDVNAQIGDSDTAGAVVMGVHNSVVEAGCEGDLCPLYERDDAGPA